MKIKTLLILLIMPILSIAQTFPVNNLTASGTITSTGNVTAPSFIGNASTASTATNVTGGTITNETITQPDSYFTLVNLADSTKKAVFNLSGFPTATTYTYTLPSASGTLASLNTTQVFTTSQVFNGGLSSTGTVTFSGPIQNIGTFAYGGTVNVGTGATTSGNTQIINIGTGGLSGSTTNVNIGSSTGTLTAVSGQMNVSALTATGQGVIGSTVAKGDPSATSISSTAAALISGVGGNSLSFGQYSNNTTWIQSSFSNPTTATYPISLQPLGGYVGIGTGSTAPTSMLQVAGTVTAANFIGNTNNIIDARSVGVKCDGTTDDAAAINAATSNLVNQAFKLPAGTCVFKSQLTPSLLKSSFIGAGRGSTILLYEGSNTTQDLIYISGANSLQASFANIGGFSIYSNTTMTAGFAVHIQKSSYITLNDVTIGDPTVNAVTSNLLYGGVWIDRPNLFMFENFSVQAKNDALAMSATGVTTNYQYDVFVTNGKLDLSGTGFHVGGGIDNVNADFVEITSNVNNFIDDNAITSYNNQEIYMGKNIVADQPQQYNYIINDSLCTTTYYGVVSIAGPITHSNLYDGIDVRNFPACQLIVSSPIITQNARDGIRIEDSSAIVTIAPETQINTNTGYGINALFTYSGLKTTGTLFNNTLGNYNSLISVPSNTTGVVPVTNGGTGVTTSTGTGSVVLNNSPTFTGFTSGASSLNTSGSSNSLTINDTGSAGAGIKLGGNGSTNPNKWIRSNNGNLQVVNSAYSAAIFSLDDAGDLSLTSSLTAPNLYGSITGTSGTVVEYSAGMANSLQRFREKDEVNRAYWSVNMTAANAQDNATYPSWEVGMGGTTRNNLGVYYSAPGTTTRSNILALAPTGLTLNTSGSPLYLNSTNSNGQKIVLEDNGSTHGIIGAAAGYSLVVTNGANTINTLSIDQSGNVNAAASISTPSVTTTSGGAMYNTSASAGIEHGSITTAGTPYIDFHSSGNNNDYDFRMIANGGTTLGSGTMQLIGANLNITALSSITTSGQGHSLSLVDTGSNGAGLLLTGQGTNPSKLLRAYNGFFQIVNSGNTAAISSLDDSGNLTLNGTLNSSTVTSSGNFIGNGSGYSIGTNTGLSSGGLIQIFDSTHGTGGTGVSLLYNGSTIAQVTSSGFNVTGTLSSNGSTINPTLSGTTGSIGGSALIAGACSTGTVSITGATTSMVAVTSPVTYPGAGFTKEAYVSSSGTVTVSVCAIIAGTPTSSTYNVRVIQ